MHFCIYLRGYLPRSEIIESKTYSSKAVDGPHLAELQICNFPLLKEVLKFQSASCSSCCAHTLAKMALPPPESWAVYSLWGEFRQSELSLFR